jgi:hypothetical protein
MLPSAQTLCLPFNPTDVKISGMPSCDDFIDFSDAEMRDFGEIDRINVKDGLSQ